MRFIREKILESRYDDGESNTREPSSESSLLNDMEVLDVGCGGGLLSEVYDSSINICSLANSRISLY